MGLFDRTTNSLKPDVAKLAKEIERLKQALSQKPNDPELLRLLGTAYENAGMSFEATETFSKLARAYHQAGHPQLAIAYYRKAEKFASGEVKASLLKNIETLYRSTGNFDEAFKISKQIIDYYLSIDHKKAARGFVSTLPPYGSKDAIYRKELVEMIGEKDEAWAQGATGSWLDEKLPRASQLIASLPGYPSAKIPLSSRQEKSMFAHMTVLIVDDDAGVSKLLSTALKSTGCNTLTAADGSEGLEVARAHHIDLIISDLLMPKMDGSQFFSALSKEERLKDIPFVCLSSRGQEDEKLAAFEKGVEDYWVKPFSISEILMKAKKILQRQYQKSYSCEYDFMKVELAGDLRLVAVSQVLRLLEAARVTGVLNLDNSLEKAIVLFEDGHLFDARVGDYFGEAAIFDLLYWPEGHFAFQSRQLHANRTIFRTIDDIFAQIHQQYQETLLIQQLPEADKILIFASPADQSPERLKELFNGERDLKNCLAELRGDIEAISLVVDFYKNGYLVEKGRATGFEPVTS